MRECTSSTTCLHDLSLFFFFNDTATTEIYTLSLHDALPISDLGDTLPDVDGKRVALVRASAAGEDGRAGLHRPLKPEPRRSEEHTSELQSPDHLVCRLLLEKKKKNQHHHYLKTGQQNVQVHN